MNDIREIKCEACPRVCPEDYQKMVEKYSRACQERDRAKEQEKHRWIPVTESLPEIGQPCLCYKRAHGENGYRFGTYLGANFSEKCAAFKSMSHYGCIGVTHWMPLPEPPEEGTV